MMIVEELIEKLKEFPKDANVYLTGRHIGYAGCLSVELDIEFDGVDVWIDEVLRKKMGGE